MLRSLSCVSCGGQMSPWLYMPFDPLRGVETAYSSVSRCGHCGLGAMNPMPEAGEIAAFYQVPDYYTHGSKRKETRYSLPERILSKLAHLADRSEKFDAEAQSLKPDARICDLGCGHADYLAKFNSLGFETVGVDPDPASREVARSRGVMVLDGTAESLPELHGKFDLVILSHSLEHCRDPKLALENVRSILKDDGVAYIEVPNCDGEAFRTFTVASMMFDAPRHLNWFTPSSLTSLAERVGFSVTRRTFMYYGRDFEPDIRSYERGTAEKVGSKRHTFTASVGVFLRSFWRRPERKYDSFGLWLRKS